MNNVTKDLSKNSKSRLLAAIDADIEKFESSGGVGDQMNASNARMVREALESLSLTCAYKLEKTIMLAEDYDPTKDKFGFGPRKINPSDYLAFCDEASIEKPVAKEVNELSRRWTD